MEENMNKKLICGLVTALTLSPVFSPAMAPAMAEEIDEIVVSATGIPTPLAQIGASVDIITAQDLERQQITYLQDALATVAGVSTYQSGGPGSTSNVFLRGMTGKYSGVYVDGMKINNPVDQQAAWAYLSTHGLESVEVLRGSQSVLYGSEAIGGAVSMFTVAGGETENTVGFQLGSFNTQTISLSSKGRASDVDYGYSIEASETDGISAANEDNGNKEDDGYESLSARGRFIWEISDALSFDLALQSVSSEVDTDANGPSDHPLHYTDFDTTGGKFGVSYQMRTATHSFSASQTNAVNSVYTVPFMQNTLSGLTNEGERQSLAYRGIFNVSENVTLLFGAENETEEYVSPEGTFDADNSAVFSLGRITDNDGLSVSYAVRQDDNEAFGQFDTGRFAGKKMFGSYGIRASYGTGFRAPSLYELFGISDYCAERLCGNETLTPEESRSRDLAVVYQPSNTFTLELAHFKVKVDNLIEYGFVAPEPTDNCLNYSSNGLCGKYEQSDKNTQSAGYEVRGSAALHSRTKLVFNFTKLDATRTDETRDIRRPEETLNLSLFGDLNERLSLSGSLQIVRDVVDDDFSNWPNTEVVNLDNHSLLDFAATYKLMGETELSLTIKNALDEDYETAFGFGTPGRAAYIGVTSSF
jgi:vitamin B12 transporter